MTTTRKLGETVERNAPKAISHGGSKIEHNRRRSSRISHMVASEIVRTIVDENLGPGDRLHTEAEMIAQFDVGRASIREALRILEGYGLIVIRPGGGGGPTVASLRPEDLGRTLSFYFHMTGATFGELLEARLIIEPVMAQLAAERPDRDHLDRLREAMAQEDGATFEIGEHVAVSDNFHYVVAGISGNRVLDLLGRSLRILYQSGVASGSRLPIEERAHVRDVHREIGQAILDGDGPRAHDLMRNHLQELTLPLTESQAYDSSRRIDWLDGV